MNDGSYTEYRQRVEDGFSISGQTTLQRKEVVLITVNSLNLFKH